MKKEFYNIANLVTKNAKILDVGCGNGELMKYITENISKDIRGICLLYTSPSPRDGLLSRMPSSA